jgi:hypothetical protein
MPISRRKLRQVAHHGPKRARRHAQATGLPYHVVTYRYDFRRIEKGDNRDLSR